MRQSVSQDRDGFHQTKRAVTICDLFVNQAYTISDIVRVFDEDRRNVVLALLDQGIAVLYAVRPEAGYFKLSEPGTISVLSGGSTKFSASAGGKHR
jgi:hypothetical protein